jgi:glutamyl-tRNA reductase
MTIIVCGMNHQTASIELREQILFSAEKLSLFLRDLQLNEGVAEAVILSTCNRSEIYVETENVPALVEWYCRQHPVAQSIIEPALYIYQDRQAMEHLMKVACGLDSLIIGEPQILGQLKTAFSESCAAGMIGPLFNRLFQHVFSVAKEIRSTTAVGACPVSVASTAVKLAKEITCANANILLIGAGDTIELVLRYLTQSQFQSVTICNRNRENGKALAERFAVDNCDFSDLSTSLMAADLVISATGSLQPIITKQSLESLFIDSSKSISFIDLAVPRDIDPAIEEFENATLYCIDDLKSIIQANVKGREHAAEKALEIIDIKCNDFFTWVDSFERVTGTIKAYRNQVEGICRLELSKALEQLAKGSDAEAVLTLFSRNFTNKLLHIPSVQLRQAGVEGRLDILQFAQELFSISLPV